MTIIAYVTISKDLTKVKSKVLFGLTRRQLICFGASVLYCSGADPVSISKRLGHAQVSTTQNIYSHLIEQADTQSAERIADAIFRTEKKLG